MDVDRLKKIAGAVRTGGKGTVRRKKKAVHKPTTTDDKRLQSTLKRLNVNTIPGIEEVMLLKDNKMVTVFSNPKASEVLPSLLSSMGGNANMEQLKGMMGGNFNAGAAGAAADDDDDDDDVPDLVDTFDEQA